MTSTTETKPTKSFGDTTTLEPLEDITEDLRARVFSKPSPQPATAESPLTTADKPAATGGTENVASSSTVQSDAEKITEAIKDAEKPTVSATPDTKRTKIVATPPTPTTPTILSRIPPGSPSPRPFSIERQVADQRKKLEALRQKRLETARKQEVLDKKMEPYKQRMVEELEHLNREMMKEEAATADDDEQFNASVEMYEELRKGEGSG